MPRRPMTFRLAAALPLAALLGSAGCATAPPAPPPPTAAEKQAWILLLEDRRLLREPPPEPAPAPAARGRRPVVVSPPAPDLLALLRDPDRRIRRRAALAVGRVGSSEGVEPLTTALDDPEPEVRQMAAFALGLIGDPAAAGALRGALEDPAALVQGRAAEALGLIGDSDAASSIGGMVGRHVAAGAVAGIDVNEEGHPLEPEAEAVRLGVYALARLKAYEALAAAVLDDRGLPRVRWWPVAYALGRIEDPRAAAALTAFARGGGRYATGFAVRGLGALQDPAAVDVLLPLLETPRLDPHLAASIVRALGRLGDRRAGPLLLALAQRRQTDPNVRLAAVTALPLVGESEATELLLDLMADPWPPMRAAAIEGLARLDADTFILVLSGLDPDPQWTVRAAVARALGRLPRERAVPLLVPMLADTDRRVIPAVLGTLAGLEADGLDGLLLERLRDDDPVVRMAAARLLGERRPPAGEPALVEAYRFGLRDPGYVARAAALGALAAYGEPAAGATLRRALEDPDWAVRLRAAALLREIAPGAGGAAAPVRPAPMRLAAREYADPGLVDPAFSPHVYIETAKGTIQVELSVLDAPLTARNFMTLARKGFFEGASFHRVVPDFVVQDGDPRGDGEGGPGYTIRDELNQRPYLRGVVGMALDWADTGGSQFFITHSPQPHLDARYTVFGRVVAGLEVVDQLQQGDVIRRVRVWDGTELTRQGGGADRVAVR